MAKKIAIIGIRGIPGNFPGSSGIDTYIEQLLPLLTKNKFTLFFRSWVKNNFHQQNQNLQIIHVPCFQHKYLDTGIYTFLSTISAIIHHHDIFWYQAPGSCLLIKLAKMFDKKTVLTIHGIDWQRQKWNTTFNRWFLKSLESMAVKNADICTGVSQDICQHIQKTYQKPCLLTPPNLIIQTTLPPKIINKKFKINNQPYILYLGRLVPEKNIDMLIKSYLKNSVLNKKYKLIIAGLIEKNNYCNNLIKLSSQNSNIVLTNYVTGQLKNELLSNCHLFILPSSLEGNSISLNEALGLNKRCLISDLPIHLQYQKKFPHITTFKNNSSSDFEKKINQSLKKIINKTSHKKNSWNKTAHVYSNIFKKL